MMLLLLLGLLLIGYGMLGLSTVYDTWSDSYPLFETLGEKNPLKDDQEFQDRFDRHWLSAKRYWYPVSIAGLAVFCLSAIAINVEAKRRSKKEAEIQL